MINSMTNSNSLILADVLLSSLHSYRMALFLSPALACAASALTIRLPRAVPLRCVCAWVPYSPWTPAQMLLSFVEPQLSGRTSAWPLTRNWWLKPSRRAVWWSGTVECSG